MEKFSYKDAKILVVDDVEEVLTSTRNCLRLQGMQVDCINNPLEALEIDELNIQGYIDKIKGKDELILLTKSAIKTSFLNKKIKKQKMEIEAQQYRNEFFGKFLYRFIGEIRERTFVIGGLIDNITGEDENISIEDKKRYVAEIKHSISKLIEFVKTLEVEEISVLTISMLQNILNSLFAIDLKLTGSKILFKYDNEYTTLQCNPKMLIYILVEIIEYLLHSNIEEITVDFQKQENKILIKICNAIKSDEINLKIEKIAQIDNRIKITNENKKIIIEINS